MQILYFMYFLYLDHELNKPNQIFNEPSQADFLTRYFNLYEPTRPSSLSGLKPRPSPLENRVSSPAPVRPHRRCGRGREERGRAVARLSASTYSSPALSPLALAPSPSCSRPPPLRTRGATTLRRPPLRRRLLLSREEGTAATAQ